MKLSVPRSSAYNLASGTERSVCRAEGTAARKGSPTRRFTTIAHNVVCSLRDRAEIFIVLLPPQRATRLVPLLLLLLLLRLHRLRTVCDFRQSRRISDDVAHDWLILLPVVFR